MASSRTNRAGCSGRRPSEGAAVIMATFAFLQGVVRY